jgi:hypothetical protein
MGSSTVGAAAETVSSSSLSATGYSTDRRAEISTPITATLTDPKRIARGTGFRLAHAAKISR